MKFFLTISVISFFTLTSCNTVMGTAKGVGRDASNLLRKVKAAKYVREHPDEVCPAKWEEGEATLAPSLDLVGKI